MLFTTLLHSAASPLSQSNPILPSNIQTSVFDVYAKQEYPSLSSIDAILITGSKADAYDNNPWILKLVAFVKTVLAQDRVRVLGVCFGHQIVGRTVGARVGRCESGWEVSVTQMELTTKGREVFAGRDTLVCSLPVSAGNWIVGHADEIRHFTSRIETSSRRFRIGWRTWRLRKIARFRACMSRDGFLQCKAIRSLRRSL